ncbi:hypothetical protein SAMN04489859_101525 [Paracoccus alcaliphilus]|uniref:Sulfotransferase family protein n=1 Tax=Paracoccus alcaliphilus TaxID=34002 RepID=A0A1H8J0Y0_9RHOB|nr:hypothetical protein [Paracoccus alcaliphilus]WCR16637.1 hypothetical protein JHW40_09240 [Paracoccus alcaliphilus]SEN74533.1 hypothetical protein SAMN04489859_101525 [Paracoccus alcaliphilus]
MLIFWDQKLVFLATPKAGSTAVESALESLASAAIQRPAPLKHADIRTFRRHIGPWIGEQAGGAFSTVALMREPVDWLRSWYRFRLRDDLDGPLHQMNDVSFAQFASDYAQDGGPSRMGIGRQCDFLIDGEHRVDRIFRYENFPSFIEYLEDCLGCALEMPRINVPPSVDVHLEPQQEEVLRRAMAADMALYQSL